LLTTQIYLHSFSCCCLRNTRTYSKRIWPYNSSRSSWSRWKAHMWLPISH